MDAWDIAEQYLGHPGIMLSRSKVAPEGQKVVWNANVCTIGHGKVWFGDLNVTTSIDELSNLAFHLNTPVYVLREMDARFENENNPLFDEAVIVVDQWGGVERNY